MTLTPEQFNKLATKDEFNELKSEVQEVKGDVKQLSEKVDALLINQIDADKKIDTLHINAINTNQRVERIEEKVDALTDSMSNVLTAVDGVVYELKSINSELAANVGAHDRFEARITKVENQLNPKPAF